MGLGGGSDGRRAGVEGAAQAYWRRARSVPGWCASRLKPGRDLPETRRKPPLAAVRSAGATHRRMLSLSRTYTDRWLGTSIRTVSYDRALGRLPSQSATTFWTSLAGSWARTESTGAPRNRPHHPNQLRLNAELHRSLLHPFISCVRAGEGYCYRWSIAGIEVMPGSVKFPLPRR